MTVPAPTAVTCDTPRSYVRWLYGVALFACFFAATQDMSSPLLWRDDGGADIAALVGRVAGGNATRQLGFLALGALGALALLVATRLPATRPVWPVWPALYPLVALVAWAFLSLLWSDDRSLTAKRLVVFTSFVLALCGTVRHFRVRDLVGLVTLYAVLTLAAGTYAEWTYRGQQSGSEGWRFSGSMSPNHSGLTATMLALAMTYALSSSPRQFWLKVMTLAAALGVLWLTRSRTALAITLLALSVQAALVTRPSRAAAVAACGAIAAAAGVFLYQSGVLGPVWEAALMGRDNSDVRTLTGRTDIWAYALETAWSDPTRGVIGHGHDSFWSASRTDAVSRRVGFTISEGHNAYLDAWLNLGVVGLLAWAAAVVAAGWVWLARGRTPDGRATPEAAFAAAVCLAALVHGMAESTFVHAQFPTFVLFCVCLSAAVRPPERYGGFS